MFCSKADTKCAQQCFKRIENIHVSDSWQFHVSAECYEMKTINMKQIKIVEKNNYQRNKTERKINQIQMIIHFHDYLSFLFVSSSASSSSALFVFVFIFMFLFSYHAATHHLFINHSLLFIYLCFSFNSFIQFTFSSSLSSSSLLFVFEFFSSILRLFYFFLSTFRF